jgi:cell division protein FtsI/penicillin-binding protein 2
MQRKNMRHETTIARLVFFLSGAALALAFLYFSRGPRAALEARLPVPPVYGVTKEIIAAQLGAQINQGEFPAEAELEVDGIRKKALVEYGLMREAQARMEAMFASYKPDYGAFVAVDARTGRILSMISYTRDREGLDNLALQATFPAASVFKVVTASAALDGNKATPDTIVEFNGANHTLYRRNVQDNRVNRWTRKMTMREAFARSVNVVFSKLGLFYVGAESLEAYAERFQFNRQIRADVPVQQGSVKIEPEDPWSIATTASGFTQDSKMSPLQGALIAAAAANDGVMMEPYLVERIQAEDGQALYRAEPREASVALEPKAAADLRALMRETVTRGTSRKAFRQALRKRAFDDVEFGGKTGSLSGLHPAGKCDWFVGYARYRDERIAVAALTVNEKKWRVKSSTLASEFLSGYIRNEKARNEVAAVLPNSPAGDR